MSAAGVDSHSSLHASLHPEGVRGRFVAVGPWLGEWPAGCGYARFDAGLGYSRARTKAKKTLAEALWKAFGPVAHDVSRGADLAVPQIACGGLGRPLLVVAGRRFTNVSFAYSDTGVWAAMCCPLWSCVFTG
jgi:hypothetical protein